MASPMSRVDPHITLKTLKKLASTLRPASFHQPRLTTKPQRLRIMYRSTRDSVRDPVMSQFRGLRALGVCSRRISNELF